MSRSNDRVTSRLVKKERKKLVRQTVYFGGIAVVIIVLFIFVILPGFLALVDKFLSGSNPFDEEDTLPPQVPIVSAPISVTKDAEVSLEGYGEPGSDIILVLNALKTDTVVVSDEGQFTVEFLLEEGENTIEFYSVDKAGNESNSTKTYVSTLDTQNPDLEISEPSNGATLNGLSSRKIEVRGKTDPGIRVMINGQRTFASSDGSFRMAMELDEGENKIEVKAVDQAENESVQEISVTLKL